MSRRTLLKATSATAGAIATAAALAELETPANAAAAPFVKGVDVSWAPQMEARAAGDLIARARPLPALAAGDVVAILDTGAYCFSAPYHFNTLPEPAVYGVRTGPRGDVRFELLRPAQTIDDLLTRSR
ncbi:hypothetical protein [Streptomyces griseus]|uniref:hypothetical protein n=1 Tax=Streptomyces griseus TaxID=1911 RepID=UPI000568FAC4|nr:hypothetical protein [Streptomyces griseus]